MKKSVSFPVLLLAAALGFAGCSGNPSNPAEPAGNDAAAQREIESEIAQAPELNEAGTYENALETELADEPEAPFSTAEAIRPIFFYREITSRTHQVTVNVERDSVKAVAHVLATAELAGIFHIFTRDTVDGEVVREHITKDLADRGRMRARFVKRLREGDAAIEGEFLSPATGDDDRTRWRLAAISHRRIASPGHTAEITSVRLQSRSGLDVTITDPLELARFPLGLPHALPGEHVRVTVQTSDPEDVVFLYTKWGRRPLRRTEEGFVGGFYAPLLPRGFRIGVNALDRGTLFDDVAPYDSDFWGLLAWVVPLRT